jgi:hypothetical protein
VRFFSASGFSAPFASACRNSTLPATSAEADARKMSYIVGLSTETNALAVVSPGAGSFTQPLDAEGCCWRPAVAATPVASATIPMSPTTAVLATRCMRHSGKKSRAFYADALSCESEAEGRRKGRTVSPPLGG